LFRRRGSLGQPAGQLFSGRGNTLGRLLPARIGADFGGGWTTGISILS